MAGGCGTKAFSMWNLWLVGVELRHSVCGTCGRDMERIVGAGSCMSNCCSSELQH